MEKLGIPTVVLQRNEFVGVTKNAVAGLGFSPEIAMVSFPVNLFLIESDVSPVKENIDKFVDGLTKWEPTVKKKGIMMPPKVRVEGENYPDALAKMNALFLQNQWADGLPLLPATEERVKWILKGTDLPPGSAVGSGKVLPRGGIATVETLAVALAMAGGRPEYLPVLIAAVEAMLDPGLNHQGWQATTCSIYPAVIVDGPIAKQIRLNSGFGLIGPDSLHPAGATIGRALRSLQQDVGGAVPGVGTMAQFGGMRYTNAVFAEDEEGLPPGWQPLNTDRFGQAKGTNTVTVYPVSSATNILRRGTGKEPGLEAEALQSLYIIAGYMKAPNQSLLYGYEEGTPGILILSSTVARQLSELGWTKEKIRKFLWDNTKIPLAEVERTLKTWIDSEEFDLKKTIKDPWPITSKPENIMIVVAGGRHPTHAYWMQAAQGPKLVNSKITLPAKWDDLLKDAENDLGPLPPQ